MKVRSNGSPERARTCLLGKGQGPAAHVIGKSGAGAFTEYLFGEGPLFPQQVLLESGDLITIGASDYRIETFWGLGRNLFEPDLTGTGTSGHRSAANRVGQLVLLVYLERVIGGQPAGDFLAVVRVSLGPPKTILQQRLRRG